MPQIGQTSHEMADSDVVIPWTALASSQSKRPPLMMLMMAKQTISNVFTSHIIFWTKAPKTGYSDMSAIF